jgi:hypothetical protein
MRAIRARYDPYVQVRACPLLLIDDIALLLMKSL